MLVGWWLLTFLGHLLAKSKRLLAVVSARVGLRWKPLFLITFLPLLNSTLTLFFIRIYAKLFFLAWFSSSCQLCSAKWNLSCPEEFIVILVVLLMAENTVIMLLVSRSCIF